MIPIGTTVAPNIATAVDINKWRIEGMTIDYLNVCVCVCVVYMCKYDECGGYKASGKGKKEKQLFIPWKPVRP